MYQSPIELIATQMQTEMANKQDDYILQTVQKMGVNVDKEELLKALKYDRDQYNKGYVDGVKEVANILESRLEGKTAVFRFGYELAIAEIKEMAGEDNV